MQHTVNIDSVLRAMAAGLVAWCILGNVLRSPMKMPALASAAGYYGFFLAFSLQALWVPKTLLAATAVGLAAAGLVRNVDLRVILGAAVAAALLQFVYWPLARPEWFPGATMLESHLLAWGQASLLLGGFLLVGYFVARRLQRPWPFLLAAVCYLAALVNASLFLPLLAALLAGWLLPSGRAGNPHQTTVPLGITSPVLYFLLAAVSTAHYFLLEYVWFVLPRSRTLPEVVLTVAAPLFIAQGYLLRAVTDASRRAA